MQKQKQLIYDSQVRSQDSSCQESQSPKKQLEEYQQAFTLLKKQKSIQEMNFLMGCLKNHFIFFNLSQAQLENVAKKMFYCSVAGDSFIFREGSKSNCFFIIEKGMMHCLVAGKTQKQLRVGEGFGEIALIYKTERNFSVKACESCCLWAIDRKRFREAVQQVIIKEYEQNKAFMENVKFFRRLNSNHKQTMVGSLVSQNYCKGDIIVKEGDPGSSFYIIKSGEASLWKGNLLIDKLKRGNYFGQQSLYYNTQRQLSVRAEGDVICLILSRQILSKILGEQIYIVTFQNFIKQSLQKSEYLSKLTAEEIQSIINSMKINFYKAGNVIIKKTKKGSVPTNRKIIIVLEGSIKKTKSIHPLAVRSQLYGEQFLFETNRGRYDDDIIMETNGVIAEIQAQQVIKIIDGYLDTIISKREDIKNQQSYKIILKKQKKMIRQLKDLKLIKEMKPGSFGPSLLVTSQYQSSQNPCLYLLKCNKKSKVQNHLIYKYIQNEIKIQKTLNHPLIAQGYKIFEDQTLFCSLVQFIQGQELFDVIREIGLLSTSDAKFYISCMVIIIEYLNDNMMYLRDIKPENFIVDKSGYPILIDLVSAKTKNQKNHQNKTLTMIGTPHYMAPEIIMNKGYNYQASLYSLGVNLFEFLCGYVPFGEEYQDPLEIYEDVLNSQLKFPKMLKDSHAKKLIQQLLDKQNPKNRQGGPSFASLKNNNWFGHLNWDLLSKKKVPAPKFVRNLNIIESPRQICSKLKKSQNCQEYLNQKFSEKFR